LLDGTFDEMLSAAGRSVRLRQDQRDLVTCFLERRQRSLCEFGRAGEG
jgi:hypothetical protein